MLHNRGMTPIEKNVRVVDAQGNEYEATYPKRAKGLVKNGRARFVDENTICLACPPDMKLEDMKMKEAAEKMDTAVGGVDFTDVKETAKTAAQKVAEYKKTFEQEYRGAIQSPGSADASKYTIDYALEQLEKVREASSKFAEDVGKRVNGFDSRNECDPDEDGNSAQSRAADALANLVVLQMRVYDKMTDFYIRMISDLTAKKEQ